MFGQPIKSLWILFNPSPSPRYTISVESGRLQVEDGRWLCTRDDKHVKMIHTQRASFIVCTEKRLFDWIEAEDIHADEVLFKQTVVLLPVSCASCVSEWTPASLRGNFSAP